MESLFELVHIGLRASIGELEETYTRPTLLTAAEELTKDLLAESGATSTDLKRPYQLALDHLQMLRSLIAADSKGSNDATRDELQKIVRDFGARRSPVLGLPTDYAAFAPNGGCEKPFACRFHAWAELPMLLGAPSEKAVSRSVLRDHARAALLLTRLLALPKKPASSPGLPPPTVGDVERLETFLAGPSDSVSLSDLEKLAKASGLDPRAPRTLADVTRIAKLSRAVLTRGAPHILDAHASLLERGGRVDPGDIRTTRILGGRYTRDADALQRVGLFVRGLTSSEEASHARSPRALDVLAWFGSPEAIATRERDFAEERNAYGTLVERLQVLVPPPDAPARHESVYASFLDLVENAHRSSVADEPIAAATTSEWQRHEMEAAAGMWATARHDFAAVGIPALEPYAPKQTPGTHTTFVEPHPEAIALMVSLVDQLTRGLRTFGALGANSRALPILREVDHLLRVSLEAAMKTANDEVYPTALELELSRLPDALSALEEATHSSVDRVAVAFRDVGRKRNVLVATGTPEELIVVVRSARTGELVPASGVALSTYEWEEPSTQAISDNDWRDRPRERMPKRVRER